MWHQTVDGKIKKIRQSTEKVFINVRIKNNKMMSANIVWRKEKEKQFLFYFFLFLRKKKKVEWKCENVLFLNQRIQKMLSNELFTPAPLSYYWLLLQKEIFSSPPQNIKFNQKFQQRICMWPKMICIVVKVCAFKKCCMNCVLYIRSLKANTYVPMNVPMVQTCRKCLNLCAE